MNVNVLELNEKVRRDPMAFAEECEADYYERIKRAAGAIIENMHRSPIVLLSGPSGAGKTTTAMKIEFYLDRLGIQTHTVSMDNYYKTMNQKTAPRTPEGDIDFESPELIDMELLNEHFDMLANHKEIKIPYFMFSRQKRSASKWKPMRLNDNEVAIFEGIHALNDVFTDKNPDAFGLYISPETHYTLGGGEIAPSLTRLVRRVVRDNNFRGADAEMTLAMWKNVMRGEKSFIDPYICKAKLRLDSSIGYELAVMRDYALPLLDSLSPDIAGYDEIEGMLPVLRAIAPMDSDCCPIGSLLREFIGGGIYEY